MRGNEDSFRSRRILAIHTSKKKILGRRALLFCKFELSLYLAFCDHQIRTCQFGLISLFIGGRNRNKNPPYWVANAVEMGGDNSMVITVEDRQVEVVCG